jgi:uncharacterized protein YbjT (DUF2867 family)
MCSALMNFFTTSTANLLAAEQTAGVAHHVALSVVGADRMPDSGYMRAKVAQVSRIIDSGIAYTILRATQFLAAILCTLSGRLRGVGRYS